MCNCNKPKPKPSSSGSKSFAMTDTNGKTQTFGSQLERDAAVIRASGGIKR